jgi:hypothetical protein
VRDFLVGVEDAEPGRNPALDRAPTHRHQQHVAGDAEEPGGDRTVAFVLEAAEGTARAA